MPLSFSISCIIISSLTPKIQTLITNTMSSSSSSSSTQSKTPKPGDPTSPNSSLLNLKTLILDNDSVFSKKFKFLPFEKRRTISFFVFEFRFHSLEFRWIKIGNEEKIINEDSFVYLGSRLCNKDVEEDFTYWAIDVENVGGDVWVSELSKKQFCFAELRTLMVATDWGGFERDGRISYCWTYQARALLEWHKISRFCGNCGGKTIPIDAGRRKQCSNEECKKRVYPRVDPTGFLTGSDRALLSRQSRFVPRMWSCLAGFIEPGESLEEAVRKKTWEETVIEVSEVIYHSSQPWPVGPNSMPCQLMVGFFAYAKSLEISVDKVELEEYEKAQRTAADKVDQMCKGVEKGLNFSSHFNVKSGELAPMFIPGPFSIAHHLISASCIKSSSQCS
ncbi:hypothetical protein MKW92_013929 [Papaver armeniacum]|nr:hypothetical protein MKW92_013929 [Papaver armeniacum]